jgi:hypothetical protein
MTPVEEYKKYLREMIAAGGHEDFQIGENDKGVFVSVPYVVKLAAGGHAIARRRIGATFDHIKVMAANGRLKQDAEVLIGMVTER